MGAQLGTDYLCPVLGRILWILAEVCQDVLSRNMALLPTYLYTRSMRSRKLSVFVVREWLKNTLRSDVRMHIIENL